MSQPALTLRVSERERYVVAKRYHNGDSSIPLGQTCRISIRHTVDDGQTWTDVPMGRSLVSWLRYGIFTYWPPENADDLQTRNGDLVLIFHDEWIPWERFPSTFLWAATLRSGRRRWVLRKLRRLDFENADPPDGPFKL